MVSPAPAVGGFFGEGPRCCRVRNPHVVDFGRNNEHAPDGHVYMTSHGSTGSKPPEWGNGDAIFLMRAPLVDQAFLKAAHWEFHAGAKGWVRDVNAAEPVLRWDDHLGHAHVVWNPGLQRFIMCISPLTIRDNDWLDGLPKLYSAEALLILEADQLWGPWRLLQEFPGFGPSAYTVSIPSKFISRDGRSAWMLYSAGWATPGMPPWPEGSGYGACFQEICFALK